MAIFRARYLQPAADVRTKCRLVSDLTAPSTGPERAAGRPAAAADAQVQVPPVPCAHIQFAAQVQPLHQSDGEYGRVMWGGGGRACGRSSWRSRSASASGNCVHGILHANMSEACLRPRLIAQHLTDNIKVGTHSMES